MQRFGIVREQRRSSEEESEEESWASADKFPSLKELNELVSQLPSNYQLLVSLEDRQIHALLLRKLRAPSHPMHALKLFSYRNSDIELDGRPSAKRKFRLHTAFHDGAGAIGTVASAISKAGFDILEASFFSTRITKVGIQMYTITTLAADADISEAQATQQLDREIAPLIRAMHGETPTSVGSCGDLQSLISPFASLAGAISACDAGGTSRQEYDGCSTTGQTTSGHDCGLSSGEPPVAVHGDEESHSQFATLELQSFLAEGSVSRVWIAHWEGKLVVVKVLKAGLLQDKKSRCSFEREVEILSQLRHPCICSFFGPCLQQGRPSIVLEYMKCGALYNFLHGLAPDGQSAANAAALTAKLLVRIVLEVARGLHYLHSEKIMHRDVKSANVLLDEQWHAKLADFNISKNNTLNAANANHTGEAGTYRYMAPEVIQNKPYNCKCDIYSFGILLWEVLHMKVPFTGIHQVRVAFMVAMENKRPQISLRPPLERFGEVIEACWQSEPKMRPDMNDVIRLLATASPIDAGAAP